MVPSVIPDRDIVGSGQSDIPNMGGARKDVRQRSDETRGQVRVEEELYPGGIETSLRSRSAANASTARMSSRSRPGKSARISASVIPDAKYSRTSYTVIRSPRMHGFPPLLPGSRVMRFKRFMPSGYLWGGSEVKPRGLASSLAM